MHHGVVGVLWPQAVYNHEAAYNAPWTWAGIHALFVLWSCVGSVVAWRFNERAFAQTALILEAAGEGIFGARHRRPHHLHESGRRDDARRGRPAVIGKPVGQVVLHLAYRRHPLTDEDSPILAPAP